MIKAAWGNEGPVSVHSVSCTHRQGARKTPDSSHLPNSHSFTGAQGEWWEERTEDQVWETGARVWGPGCPKLAVWLRARPPGTCFSSPYGKDFTNARRVIRPALKSRTLILCEKSVQERHTRVSMWLYHAVSSLRPTNPLEVKERSQQAEVDRPCREQTQSHTECLWPVCMRTISYKLSTNHPWVNFPTKWLQAVGTENL